MASTKGAPPEATTLDLYWIPLGAGARVVQTSGKLYEAAIAFAQHRDRRPLYHSALIASVPEGRYCMEMTPIPRAGTSVDRGVVGEGAVGSSLLGRYRIFRYELRCWLNGNIPDLGYAVCSPVTVTSDERAVRRVLNLMPLVPTPTWGRDELHTGEMWNSNSVLAWMLRKADLVEAAGVPPNNGRAPGWNAGLAVAARDAVDLMAGDRAVPSTLLSRGG